MQAAIQALRATAPSQHIPPAQILNASFVADDGAGGAAARLLYESFDDAFRALARVAIGGGSLRPASTARPSCWRRAGALRSPRRRIDRGEESPGCAPRSTSSTPRCAAPRPSWPTPGSCERAPQAVVDKERAKLAAHVADRDELAARLRGLS